MTSSSQQKMITIVEQGLQLNHRHPLLLAMGYTVPDPGLNSGRFDFLDPSRHTPTKPASLELRKKCRAEYVCMFNAFAFGMSMG